jgi:hypothetical protein
MFARQFPAIDARLLAAAALMACGCSLDRLGELEAVSGPEAGVLDAAAEASGPCKAAKDCISAAGSFVPVACAEWVCELPEGKCRLASRDRDGDGHRDAKCTKSGSMPVTPGDDCDDNDPESHPGAWDGPAAHVVPFGIALPGWQAAYFASPALTGPAVTQRLEPAVDFDWQLGTPDPGIGPGPFGARWEGSVVAPQAGTYTLHVACDDGARLWVEGALVLDLWASQGPVSTEVEVVLQGNVPTPIKLEYFNAAGKALIKLEWEAANIARRVLRVQSKPSTGEKEDRCDGIDQDCSLVADDAEVVDGTSSRTCASCPAGATRACGSSTTAPCHQGVETCLMSGQWGGCAGEQLPEAELCDGVDNDCDGASDDGFEVGAACTAGIGACARDGVRVCDGADAAQCSAAAAIPDENFHTVLSPNGSWDWNCNGTVEPWMVGFLDAAWCTKLALFCAELKTAALCTQGAANNVGSFVFPCFGTPSCGTKIAMQQCYWAGGVCYPYYTDLTNYRQACK